MHLLTYYSLVTRQPSGCILRDPWYITTNRDPHPPQKRAHASNLGIATRQEVHGRLQEWDRGSVCR